MPKRTVAARCAIAIATLAAAVTLQPTPAQATAKYGCPYPWVCFMKGPYKSSSAKVVAKYQDVTNYYQKVTPAASGSDWLYNSRNDDRVQLVLEEETNAPFCVRPNSTETWSIKDPSHIMIQTQSACKSS
ncbi:hypothetical protein ABT160_25625 [Streptomyces sp. NPDC001941]|uniref:hypothetical protein n=1 Tax=Streptomyces sp. NPDC001941 TaxID=3154659 RepID=UPI00332DCFD7